MAKAPIFPLNDRVLVKRLKPREVTKGGIFLSEGAKELPTYGVVCSLGDDVKSPKLRDNVMVLFGKYSGTEVDADGESYLVMREEEIMGVVVDAEIVQRFVEAGA